MIDYNKLQSYGHIKDVLELEPLTLNLFSYEKQLYTKPEESIEKNNMEDLESWKEEMIIKMKENNFY